MSVLTALLLVTAASPLLNAVVSLAVVLLLPSARRLPRRLTINLSLVVGWAPLALSVPPVSGPATGASAGIALAAGIIGAHFGGSSTRKLIPVAKWRDLTIAAAGASAGALAWPLLFPETPARALGILTSGFDNAFHFAIFLELRMKTAGRSDLLAANADGSAFAFSDYPSWFHKLVTTIANVIYGAPTTSSLELIHFGQLLWLVFVLIAALMTAAMIQSLPETAPTPVIVSALALVWSLFLCVPASLNLYQGHLPFLLAACGPVVILLVVVAPHPFSFATGISLIGLVLLTASWMLLLPLAAAALAVPVVRLWAGRRKGLRWALVLGVAFIGALAMYQFVAPWISGGGLRAILRDGAVMRINLPVVILLTVGPLALLTAWIRRGPRSAYAPHLLVAGTSVLQLIVLGGYMLAQTGELTYYFWKLSIGAVLASLVALVHAASTEAVANWHAVSRQSRGLFVAVSLTLGVLGLGITLQDGKAPSVIWGSLLPHGLDAQANSQTAGDTGRVLTLAERTPPRRAATLRPIFTAPGDMNPALAWIWFHALSHSATRATINLDDPIFALGRDVKNTDLAKRLAIDTLESTPESVVVTDPRLYREILEVVGPSRAARVLLDAPDR